MSVSIKVAIRCRPFSERDTLGVSLHQHKEEEGEVNLLGSKYTVDSRFAFTYAWWSGFGYQKYIQNRHSVADGMNLITQGDVYERIGQKLKAELLDGSAVVLFAYGLSGSGKTYTVFGPDAVDQPEAWFKHATPHDEWGIFPRLAFELMSEIKDGWKFTMKYFQNVVDIVRDLMSPVAMEKHYKTGIRKDVDGFTDISWCSEKQLTSWNDLRSVFLKSNARKAISSTQFNHHSTRGHCILTLEVHTPHPTMPGIKQRGRVYICDLAGTEPAGDIVHGNYEKKYSDEGATYYEYLGPHPESIKTKELRDQGTKINLSLSEMSQFFLKMAQAIENKNLKPGKSIPGCNSYFLCKYLKDTMLQARTYLFCAIRPESKFMQYTFSTLCFAKNASVIKLQPKKATTEMSASERKLLQELDQMRSVVKQLKKQNRLLQSSATSEQIRLGSPDRKLRKLEAELEEKQVELMNEVFGNSKTLDSQLDLDLLKDEYSRRGLTLVDGNIPQCDQAYFLNLDEDCFLNHRYMCYIRNENTTFGPGGEVRPTDFAIVSSHCSVKVLANHHCELFAGLGDTWHNGKKLPTGSSVILHTFDRVAMGHTLFLFVGPKDSIYSDACPSAEFAASELRRVIFGSGLLQQDRDKVQNEIARYKQTRSADTRTLQKGMLGNDPERIKLLEMERERTNRDALLQSLPMTDEVSRMLQLLNRPWLKCESVMTASYHQELRSYEPQVRIKVINAQTTDVIYMDPYELHHVHGILQSEIVSLRSAFEQGKDYVVPFQHDPLELCYNHCFHLGTATAFMEQLAYNLETDVHVPDEVLQEIAHPGSYESLGSLEMIWTPLSDTNEQNHNESKILEIMDPRELLGKSFIYKLQFFRIIDLPFKVSSCYCQYTFFGETYITEKLENLNSNCPSVNYTCIHHIPKVKQEFLDYLAMDTMRIDVFVQPAKPTSQIDEISTQNIAVASSLGGFKVQTLSASEKEEIVRLKAKVKMLEEKNEMLISVIKEISSGLSPEMGKSSIKEKIENAIKYGRQVSLAAECGT